MRSGLRAIALTVLPMTLRTFLRVDIPSRMQVGLRGRQGVFEAFVFLGNDPGLVFLGQPVGDDDADENEQGREEKFAKLESARRVGGHENRKNFRISRLQTEG